MLQEVELKIVFVSDKIQLERPFQAVLKLQSNVDRQLGPLTVAMPPGIYTTYPHAKWCVLAVCFS